MLHGYYRVRKFAEVQAMRNRAGVVAAVVVVLALGAWGYSWYATHSARASIVALVNDTSERLRAALQAKAKIAPHVNPSSLADPRTIADARTAALDALARVDENTKKVTSLDAYRGARRR
jgi:hypothetical protein